MEEATDEPHQLSRQRNGQASPDISSNGHRDAVTRPPEDPSFGNEVLQWVSSNVLYAVVPLLTAYLLLRRGDNWTDVLERGDTFIISAGLIAQELALLRPIQRKSKQFLENCLFGMMALSTVLFVGATANYNATHPEIDVEKGDDLAGVITEINSTGRSKPFEHFDDSAVVVTSMLFFLTTCVLVVISIRIRIRVNREVKR